MDDILGTHTFSDGLSRYRMVGRIVGFLRVHQMDDAAKNAEIDALSCEPVEVLAGVGHYQGVGIGGPLSRVDCGWVEVVEVD